MAKMLTPANYWIVAVVVVVAVRGPVRAQPEIVAPIIIESSNQTTDPTTTPAPETPKPTTAPPRLKKKPKSLFVFGDPNSKPKKDGRKKKKAKAKEAVDESKRKARSTESKPRPAKKDDSGDGGAKRKTGTSLQPLSNPGSLTKGMLGSAFAGFHGKRHDDD